MKFEPRLSVLVLRSLRNRPKLRSLIGLTAGSALCLWFIGLSAWSFGQGSGRKAYSKLYVQRSHLEPRLRESLKMLGDRLERPGKERIDLVGTIRKGPSGPVVPFRMVRESTGRLRVEQGTGLANILLFDGTVLRKPGGEVTGEDEILFKTFKEDWVDQFFLDRMQGYAIRFLGSHFRLPNSPSPYTGPYFHIYQVHAPVLVDGRIVWQGIKYFFRQDNLFLERIEYETKRDGARIGVSLEMSDWAEVQSQRIPGRIIRRENTEEILRVDVRAVVVSPAADDTIFTTP